MNDSTPDTEMEEIGTGGVLSIFDICETDTNAEEEGKWFNDVFQDGSNINVKIRRMTSRKSIETRRRLDKANRMRQRKDGTYAEEVARDIMNRQIASAIIVDWNGIHDRDKSVIPFSEENALKLLNALPTFRDLIAIYSSDMDNFRLVEAEAAEKN